MSQSRLVGFSPLNAITPGDGFYVSYNDYDVGIYGTDTTAVVVGQMERFYILNGDHRSAYQGLIASGLDACLDYFRTNTDVVNFRSDRLA